jgi:hypothetical protein
MPGRARELMSNERWVGRWRFVRGKKSEGEVWFSFVVFYKD